VMTNGNIFTYSNPSTLTILDGNVSVGIGGRPYPSLIYVVSGGKPA
jgi:hypothetical protein